MAGELQFAAFLSYSRKDARLARWLVRSLEELRLPRQTVDDLKARRAAFVAPRPIFRDEHDMPVGGVISERLSEMLDGSATMIVLCTAASAKSDWVNKEIALFSSRHPERRIIPAVGEGEPDSDASYPPALLKLGKPLAADLRNPSERRQSVIKIAAAVLGLDVDQLVGRIQKHRAEQRRWFALGGASAAAVVVGLGATAAVMANNAKQANDRAFVQVEQLLTEARADMDDLAAKKALHEVAKPYFDGEGARHLNDRDLLLKAEWLRQRAEDAYSRGQRDEALSLWTEAYDITREILARSPNDPDHLYAHIQSAFWMGDWHSKASGDASQEAWRRYWLESFDTAKHLVDVAPDYPNAALELAYARTNVGIIAMRVDRDSRAAAAYFAAARPTQAEAANGSAAGRRELAVLLGHHSAALAQHADVKDVFGVVDEWAALVDRLNTESESNQGLKYRVALDLHQIGELQRQAGRTTEAKTRFRRALSLANTSLASDPDNAAWRDIAEQLKLFLGGDQPPCETQGGFGPDEFSQNLPLRRFLSCLRRHSRDAASSCGVFAEWLKAQRPKFLEEITLAGALQECSGVASRAGDQPLQLGLDEAAETVFFNRDSHELSIWTQFRLAGMESGTENAAAVRRLREDLTRRGWQTNGNDR